VKRKLLILFLAITSVFACAFGLSACDKGNGNTQHIHSYKVTVIDPTCTDRGYNFHECTCGESYKDTYVDALGHKFENYVSNNDATCTTNGTETAVCSRDGCNQTDIQLDVGSGGHKFENYVSNNDATCTKNGTETSTCTRCTKTNTREIRDSALGHKFTDGVCGACGQLKPSEGLEYSFDYINGYYEVNGIGTCTDTNIVIADFYEGSPVGAIALFAFKNCREIKSVIIPDSVISIGYGAFEDCSRLTSVNLGNGVTEIDGSAFSGCKSLTSINIPNSVTSIGGGAFSDCDSLTYNEYDNAYYLGNSDNLYLALVKAKDKSITSCTINENTKVICGSAFEGCSGLTSITIPDGVTEIVSYVFWGCSSLTDINFKGTKAQWRAIEKGYSWNLGTGEYTVHCSDGDF